MVNKRIIGILIGLDLLLFVLLGEVGGSFKIIYSLKFNLLLNVVHLPFVIAFFLGIAGIAASIRIINKEKEKQVLEQENTSNLENHFFGKVSKITLNEEPLPARVNTKKEKSEEKSNKGFYVDYEGRAPEGVSVELPSFSPEETEDAPPSFSDEETQFNDSLSGIEEQIISENIQKRKETNF